MNRKLSIHTGLAIVIFILAAFVQVGYTTAATCQKTIGDSDCNGIIDVADFEIWRKEYTGSLTTKTSDFDANGAINIADFEIWRKTNVGGSRVTLTPTSGAVTPTPTTGGATPPASSGGMWISSADLAKLPMSGAAWTALKAAADGSPGSANVQDQENNHDVYTLAEALVYARTGTASYRTKAAQNIIAAIGTESGGRVLALARNMPAYVIAADLINLKTFDATKDQQFRAWIKKARDEQMTECDNLVLCHNRRPNNWGTHSGAARAAIDIYLGDRADLDKAVTVFKGWLGDRAVYAGFEWGDLSWQCDSSKPVGINPSCLKSGHSIDGVVPDDQRRAGGFSWPPAKENYVYEGLQGAIVQAILMQRAGYDVLNASNKALLRAYTWLHDVDKFDAVGDDMYQPYLVNYYYGSSFPTGVIDLPGKNMGWTNWTHAK